MNAARRMKRALEQAHQRGLSPVAIYGTGNHTAKILAALLDAPAPIAAFLDDDPRRQGQRILGWEIIAPGRAKERGVQAIILNSDYHERRLWARRAELEKDGIVVLRLYADGDTSPADPASLSEIEARTRDVFPLSCSAVHQYWAARGGPQADSHNAPLDYTKNITWSLMLAEWLRDAGVGPTDPILELGCNIGRNLAWLRRQGFQALGGIEINPHAIKAMKDLYPTTAGVAEITSDSLENALPKCATDAYQVVFTMAVLTHIHPDSDFIFDHMVRIARRYVFTIEDEGTSGSANFQRDYEEVFTRRGCRQVRALEFAAVDQEQFTLLNLHRAYVARLFEVQS